MLLLASMITYLSGYFLDKSKNVCLTLLWKSIFSKSKRFTSLSAFLAILSKPNSGLISNNRVKSGYVFSVANKLTFKILSTPNPLAPPCYAKEESKYLSQITIFPSLIAGQTFSTKCCLLLAA